LAFLLDMKARPIFLPSDWPTWFWMRSFSHATYKKPIQQVRKDW
jgi:hypothetical protein